MDDLKQLEDRLKKAVSMIIKYGLNSSDIPRKAPAFITDSILQVRAAINGIYKFYKDSLNSEQEQNKDKVIKDAQVAQEFLQKQFVDLQEKYQKSTEQVLNLQLALENIEQSRATEAQYRLDALAKRLRASESKETQLKNKIRDLTHANEELLETQHNLLQTNQELNEQINNLNNHIETKLVEISSTQDIDRQLIGNWLIQFLLEPTKRKNILGLMSVTLGFTPNQQKQVENALISPNAINQSMSDKWISFLLTEADVQNRVSDEEYIQEL